MATETTEVTTRRSESQISADVRKAQAYLDGLYVERRGRLCEPPEGLEVADPSELWAWCGGCGKVKVHAGKGEDTCLKCISMC